MSLIRPFVRLLRHDGLGDSLPDLFIPRSRDRAPALGLGLSSARRLRDGHVSPPRRGADPETSSEYMKPDELAERLGVSIRTLTRWRDEYEEGPSYVRVDTGRYVKVFYHRDDVAEWLRRCEIPGEERRTNG